MTHHKQCDTKSVTAYCWKFSRILQHEGFGAIQLFMFCTDSRIL